MPTSSVVFEPEFDERTLDRELRDVDRRLEESADDIQAQIETDVGGVAGVGDGVPGGDEGLGTGGAAGVGALASKLPKPVAGVGFASVLPVALGGGVGLGMLSAMRSSSARLQTSTSLLSQAWNNVWRPIGDRVDDLFVRDAVLDIMNATQDFEDTFREGQTVEAVVNLTGDVLEAGSDRGVGEQIVDNLVSQTEPGVLSREISEYVNDSIEDNLGIEPPLIDVPQLTSDLQSDIVNAWPGWPEINVEWPGWPSIKTEWPEWPSIRTEWPGWPQIKTEWQGWPEINPPKWPSTDDILGRFPSISVSDFRRWITGGNGGSDSGGSGDNGFFGGLFDDFPGLQTGGRVTGSGVARVHRGELVADPDRLVSELSRAVSDTSGGRRQAESVDVSGVESRLDRLHRDIQALSRAMSSLAVEVDGETLGRVTQNSRRNRLGDTDPRIG